jgi:hypothetical protein
MVVTAINERSSSLLVDQILNEEIAHNDARANDAVLFLRYCAVDLKNRVPVLVAKLKSDL